MNISTYTTKYNRPTDNNFAQACYDQNSISELDEMHQSKDADITDCITWDINKNEWSDAIEIALQVKLFERDLQNEAYWALTVLKYL